MFISKTKELKIWKGKLDFAQTRCDKFKELAECEKAKLTICAKKINALGGSCVIRT